MLRVHIARGTSLSLTRRVDGPLCIPVDREDRDLPEAWSLPWFVVPDEDGVAVLLHGEHHQPLARLAPGEVYRHGDLSVRLVADADDDPGTDPLFTLRTPGGLALAFPDGRRVPLGARPLVIGTAPGTDVVLADPAVSARHGQVHRVGRAWMLTDLGSTNGVWIGGARVPTAALGPGVTVTLGRTRVECVPDVAPPDEVIAPSLVGASPAMDRVRAAIARFAPAPYPVLVGGESGVGKELVAREIHRMGPHRDGPLVTVNCAAIAPDVIESELFGHEKGAFTGAVGRRRGLFEEAHQGTLFLDEIGDLPLPLQVKLLRVLETGELRRVGGEQTIRARPRVVSATLRDLPAMVAEGRFREDLFFRLADFQVTVPPLRERQGDIPALVEALLRRIGADTGRHCRIEERAVGRMVLHPWPGNVRELLAVLKRAVFLCEGDVIGLRELRFETKGRPARPRREAPAPMPPSLPGRWPDEVQRGDLPALHRWCEGNLTRMAAITGMARSTLRERIRRHGDYAGAADDARLTGVARDPRMAGR
ncbi:MAG: Response regulator of zinc sigma-54-dependent two-component system [Myxococcaceae bacterium]|nr:Response regulator of zinc sigma-54-dependent two-component system [Myxococcaceae bacterium]